MFILQNIFHFIKNHKKLSFLSLVILLILVYVFRPKPPPPPETIVVKKTDLIQSVSVSGTVEAKKKADLSFLTSGPLVYLGAKQNDTVTAGQTIAIIDHRTIEKNLENAVDAYQNQKISYDVVNDFNGDRALSDTGLSIAARRQLETAVNTLDQTQLAVDIQQIAKEQSILTSPINGILTRMDATAVGMTVGSTTVFTITDPSSLVFSMDVDEADIGKISLGQPVKITLDAFPDNTFTYPVDTIDFVSHTTSNGGNAFTVETKLQSTADSYRVGMNGNADIITAEKKNVLTVPSSSIADNNSVYVKQGKTYEKRKITTGLQSDVDTEVVSGLSEGDIVVTQPSLLSNK